MGAAQQPEVAVRELTENTLTCPHFPHGNLT
jgi:hypothetical protein